MPIDVQDINRPKEFTVKLRMSPSEYEVLEYLIKRERSSRQLIITKAVLDYCEVRIKFYEMLQDVDKKHMEEFRAMRKLYLETVNKMEQRRREMIDMLPEENKKVLKPFKKELPEDEKLKMDEEEKKKLDMEFLADKEEQDDEDELYDYGDAEDDNDEEDEEEPPQEYEDEGAENDEYLDDEESAPFKLEELHG